MGEKVVIIEVPAPLDVEKKAAAPVEEISKSKFPLPVKSSFKQKNKPGFRMPLLSVRVVLGWAFISALAIAITLGIVAIIVYANITIPSSIQTSKFFQGQGRDLTPAQTADVDFFWEAYLWSTLPQGVAATVGLLLPRRYTGGRWSLAFLAIVSATVAHCFNARTVSIFIADHWGSIWYRILVDGGAVVYLVLDLLGLLSLLIGGPEKIE